MKPPSHSFLCYAGLGKLVLSGLLATLAALGALFGWWGRDDTLALMALAIGVGTGGHALVQAYCHLPRKGK